MASGTHTHGLSSVVRAMPGIADTLLCTIFVSGIRSACARALPLSSGCRCGRFDAAFPAAARARAPSGAVRRSTTIAGRRWARCRRCRCSATPTWSDWSHWPDAHAARLAATPRSSSNRRAPWSNGRTAASMRPPRSSAEQLICWRATIGTMPLVNRLGQRHVVEWAMAELCVPQKQAPERKRQEKEETGKKMIGLWY